MTTALATVPRNRMETNQDVGTDPVFFRVVHHEFSFAVDLAASKDNAKCPVWFGQGDGNESAGGSLDKQWHRHMGWLWLNPPFRDVEPWARKCILEASLGAKIAMLVPVATGAEWFRSFVWGKAEIRFLAGRLTFEFIHQKDSKPNAKGEIKHRAGDRNTDPFPKDLMLCLYERGRFPRADPWDWKQVLPKKRDVLMIERSKGEVTHA